MAIGIIPDKAAVDQRLGQCALAVNDALETAALLKAWLDTKSEADFVALGYTAGEYAQAVSALADLNQLRTIYRGDADLDTAKDFRTFARLLYGFGKP